GEFRGPPSFVACAEEARGREGDLGAFSTGEAARDLGAHVDATRRPGVPVLVWGGSYGAYWAHRYLVAHPHQADGVVLDSGCLASACNLAGIDRSLEDSTRTFLSACGAACADRLGADPWRRATTLADRIAAGHCATLGLDRVG